MKILHRGKPKESKDNWFWRCPYCHTIGYHETEDGYKGILCGEYSYFFCPVCGEQIRDNRYFNRLIAWLLWIWYEYKKIKNSMTDKEKLKEIKKLANAMYYAAQYLTTDASQLHKAMDDYHSFIVHEYNKDEQADKPIDFEQELYKAFGQVKDFTLGMQIAKKFYEIGRLSNVERTVKNWKEPVNEDLEEEIGDTFLKNKCNITDNVSLAEFARIAKHFFELGMQVSNKAQKGE